jgi:hypothetical protein
VSQAWKTALGDGNGGPRLNCACAWCVATNGTAANSTITAAIAIALTAIVFLLDIICNFYKMILVRKHLKKVP